MSGDDGVLLEGGERDGDLVLLSAMRHTGVGTFELEVVSGVYRHDEEAAADFRDGDRVAVFEPSVE